MSIPHTHTFRNIYTRKHVHMHTHTLRAYTRTHTPAGSENEIFQATISAANSITEDTCTKICYFPDGEIGKS